MQESETICATDVGLEPGAELPFEFRPAHVTSPLVVSFPHIGLDWPARLGPRPQVSFPRNADFAVDRVFPRAEELGAATIRARWSRLVVDLNRPHDDVAPGLVPDHPAPNPRPSRTYTLASGERRTIRNRGVVWTSAIGNIPLLGELPYADFEQRIALFHAPYHRALECLLARRVERFGYAILLDAHSMPGSVAGELVLGTRAGTSAAPEVQRLALAALGAEPGGRGRAAPLELAVDVPYQGGEIAARHGHPELNVHVLQLEISRSLYMDEFRLEVRAPTPALASSPSSPRARAQAKLRTLMASIDRLIVCLAEEREDLCGRAAAE